MRKYYELNNDNSCLNRARSDEMVFTLIGHDEAAPHAIREWVKKRIELGKNVVTDAQIVEALLCARTMEQERGK